MTLGEVRIATIRVLDDRVTRWREGAPIGARTVVPNTIWFSLFKLILDILLSDELGR